MDLSSTARSDDTARNDPGLPRQASEAFVAQYPYLSRTLRRLGVRPEDAEDLAQDVFLIVCQRWTAYDRSRPLRAWLAGIAFNVVQKHRTRQRRETPAPELEIVDDTPQADERLHAARASRAVLSALDSMPPNDRAVLVLHQIEELPMPEVAVLLRVPIFTAYTRLRRARMRFTKRVAALQAEWFSPDARAVPLSAEALLDLERQHLPADPKATDRARQVIRSVAAGLGSPMTRPKVARRPFRPALTILIAALGLVALWLLHRSSPGARGDAKTVGGTVAPAASPALDPALAGYWAFEDGPDDLVARDSTSAHGDCLLHQPDPVRRAIAGVVGSGLRLQRAWLECPQAPSTVRADTELSVLAWVRLDPGRGLMAFVTRQLDEDHRDYFFFGSRDRKLKVRSSLWPADLNADQPFPAGRWVFVAFTHGQDGTTRLFQDGQLVAEKRNNHWTQEAPLLTPIAIGVGINGPEQGQLRQQLTGDLDEVALYSRALRPEEIKALSQNPGRRGPPPP
jgi:RNA polymerase sigma-70 factor (ECF subfamily)